MQIAGAPDLCVCYLLSQHRCSSEKMNKDPGAARPGLLDIDRGLLQGWS